MTIYNFIIDVKSLSGLGLYKIFCLIIMYTDENSKLTVSYTF